MKLRTRALVALTTALITFASLPGESHAAVTYSTEPGTGFLLVTFNESTMFTLTGGTTHNLIEVVLVDAYASAQSNNWGNTYTTSTSTLTHHGETSVTSNSYMDGGILNHGSLGPMDLALIYSFPSTLTMLSGDTLVLEPGTFSLGKVMPLPTNTNPDLRLAEASDLQFVSGPATAVPEPSSAALLVGLSGLALLRRRK